MQIVFATRAWEDYLHPQRCDHKLVERINLLIREILRDPHRGIGKPEPLRHALAGWWSRRIDDTHRIVYRVEAGRLLIAQLRYHY